MGMVEVASPITVNGQYLGSLMIGQVRIEKEEYDTIEQLCHSKVDLNSYPILKDLYESSKRDLPFVPLKKLKAFSKLLHNIANYIAEISASNIIQRRVDQLNFEILEKENTNNLLAKNLVQLELRNIQMQINPQFLFKTLNTINNLVILEQPQQASEIISTLSELLRRNTRRVEGLVTLRDEWNNVQNYLSIRELIRADDVKVETSIDESCLDALVPPFLIQPLVEKALVHGLGPKVNEGALSVGISRSDNMVKITVADDGVGMGKKELDYFGDLKKSLKVDSSVGGFANILAILRHYFEDEFDWNVRSSHGKGTSFEFLVPYRPNEEGSV
jgi:sensor histidine kinase YesM